MNMIARHGAGGGPGAFGRPGRLAQQKTVWRYAHVGAEGESQTRYAAELAKLVRRRRRPHRDPRVPRLAARKPRARWSTACASARCRWRITISPRSTASTRTWRCSTRRSRSAIPSTRCGRPREATSPVMQEINKQAGGKGRRAHRRQFLSRRAPAHRALSGEVAEGHGRARSSAPCRSRCGIR